MEKLKLLSKSVKNSVLGFAVKNPCTSTIIVLGGLGMVMLESWRGSTGLKMKFDFEKKFVIPHSENAFINELAPFACSEMVKYKIPASITIAQGWWESKEGKSPLALKHKNFFGMKCFEKGCGKGHCVNVIINHGVGDSREDLYRKFTDMESSTRAHSKILMKDVYKPLFSKKITDYEGWARGLTGIYATDPDYWKGIVKTIEKFKLWKYDEAVLGQYKLEFAQE